VRTPLTRYTTRIQWLSEVMFSRKNGKGSALEYPSFGKSRGAVAGAEKHDGIRRSASSAAIMRTPARQRDTCISWSYRECNVGRCKQHSNQGVLDSVEQMRFPKQHHLQQIIFARKRPAPKKINTQRCTHNKAHQISALDHSPQDSILHLLRRFSFHFAHGFSTRMLPPPLPLWSSW
jgi:hypothetical protein